MDGQEIITGGVGNEHGQIAPTILDNVDPDSPVMQEEIFGLEFFLFLTYHDIETSLLGYVPPKTFGIIFIQQLQRTTKKRILQSLSFGGGCCIQRLTIMHLASHHLPFGVLVRKRYGQLSRKTIFRPHSAIKKVF